MNDKKIPEIKIQLKPESAEARNMLGFKWAGEDADGQPIGLRHKFGGDPYWLQGDETPKCECGVEMTLYAQLDSLGDDVCIADCGMIYVFICLDCLDVKSVLQSY
ncbi:MAG: DUF1963 domain-containing protein [Desulfobacterales bacterium]|nr:DUF1963 domain-containing protein [Desulfobacterales bacterium]